MARWWAGSSPPRMAWGTAGAGLVRKYGGVRATQAVLLAAAGMLAMAAFGRGVTGLALAALVLGLGYGAAARPALICWCRKRRSRCSTS